MPTHVSAWWTDDRIDATVDEAFILAQLTPDERTLLGQSISFGGGLTDDTYRDWILDRAKKFFLILVEIGVPDQIFGLVDESYDDADLPITLSAVPDLRLTQDPDRNLDKKFYKTQFKFLIRNITEGQNLQYTEEETIPVEPVGLKAGIVPLGKDVTDKVRLATSHHAVFARKRVPLNQPPNHVSEADVLAEISSLRKLVHQHLASIYASYSHGDSIYVLLTPASEYTLKSFIADPPKHFDNLPKSERRDILINWPHCLANGLDWLHAKGLAHGAVRPSNVLVDAHFRIFLGQGEAFNITHSSIKADDVETYQYAAPERWKRSAKVQTSGPGKVALPSGGRTGRRQSECKGSANPNESNRNWPTRTQTRTSTPRSSLDTVKPTSPNLALRPTSNKSSPETSFDQPSTPSEASFASSGSTSVVSGNSSERGKLLTGRLRTHTQGSQTPSIPNSIVTTDTTGNSNAARSVLREPVILASPETRTTIVQTWHSENSDPLPTDIFALGAVIADILTFLCKRGSGSFSRFRSAKNRTAGRGGGLADASFHANIGQVVAWLTLLVHDARKKAHKDEGRVFRAVEPMVEVLKACLEREPEDRIKSAQLEKRLGDCVWLSANIGKLHCYKALQALAPPKTPAPIIQRQRTEPISRNDAKFREESEQAKLNELAVNPIVTRAHSGESGTHIPPPGPESSTSSLSSFNFEYEFNPGRSEAGQDDDNMPESESKMKHHAKGHVLDMERVVGMRESQKHSRGHSWDNWHNNDSTIDPILMLSQSNPGKTCTNFIYDSSSSDDGHQKSFLLPQSPRGSMVPAPVQAQVRREQSNPPIANKEPSEPSSEQLRTKSQPHIRGNTSTVAKENMTSSNTTHQPNSSRTRTNRSMELLKFDEIERSLRSSEVQKALNANPTRFSRRLEAGSNFSRPRFPGQNQAQESGKSYLLEERLT
jgi:serine/threonine protein kinase